MGKNTVIITIESQAGQGGPSITIAIAEFLVSLGVEVEGMYSLSGQTDLQAFRSNKDVLIDRIKANNKITIKNKQIPRKP